MKKRNSQKVPFVTTPVSLVPGAGVWLMLFCKAGHLLKQFRRGNWSDARKKYGRKNSVAKCYACGRQKAEPAH